MCMNVPIFIFNINNDFLVLIKFPEKLYSLILSLRQKNFTTPALQTNNTQYLLIQIILKKI